MRRKNRLRFLVREAAGRRDTPEAFRTSFGLKDLDELSDRLAQQLAERRGLGPAELYEELLRKHMVHLALLRISRDRREQVKEQLGIPTDEALGGRVVDDVMRDRGLEGEEAHEYLLRLTVGDRCVEAIQQVLASTGVATDEFDELLAAARIDGAAELRARVEDELAKIDGVRPDRLELALAAASSPSPVELAMFLVALELRGYCADAGARQAEARVKAIRARLSGRVRAS